MSYFDEIIDKHDQYEVAKAQADLAINTNHLITERLERALADVKAGNVTIYMNSQEFLDSL